MKTWYVQLEDPSIEGATTVHIVGPFASEVKARRWVNDNLDLIQSLDLEADWHQLSDPDDIVAEMTEEARTR